MDRVTPARDGDESTSETGDVPLERIAWAVVNAGARVPGATCLERALAAQLLFGRRGYASSLQIGVAKNDHVQAHAWVEYDGDVVVGDCPELEQYEVLSDDIKVDK